MYHGITSDNDNVLVRATIEGKSFCFKMNPKTGQHLKHRGELFPSMKEYEAAKVAWNKKELPLPAELTKHVDAIVATYKEPAPVAKKKQKEPETQTT